jgi:rieske iron-sulfur protein
MTSRMHSGLRSPYCRRRDVLGLALTPLLAGAARADEAASMPPQPGDHFVYFTGPGKGEMVRVDDLALGGPQIQAYPAAPDGTVRDASRLNLVILARFDPAALADETRARAAGGIVAYSGVCTHQGCPVNQWSREHNAFVCSCHGSVFDPRDAAEVLDGPAPRRLPALGVKIADGAVVVAAGFSGRVGGSQG